MTYNPINENIVIEEVEVEAVTASGIIIENTEAADVIVPKGKVIAISPTVKTGVELGDMIIYPKYSGLLLEKGIRILEIDQVLAVCHS